jgi:hypothetical protein
LDKEILSSVDRGDLKLLSSLSNPKIARQKFKNDSKRVSVEYAPQFKRFISIKQKGTSRKKNLGSVGIMSEQNNKLKYLNELLGLKFQHNAMNKEKEAAKDSVNKWFKQTSKQMKKANKS